MTEMGSVETKGGLAHLLALPWFWYALAALLACLFASPAWGLVFGVLLGLTVGNPAKAATAHMSKLVLQWAVSLLGFGITLHAALEVGASSALVTLISIAGTLVLGMALGRAFGVDKELSLLLSGGTAICGGSAIAAFSSSLRATHLHTAVAMAVIFTLNGVALIVFPPLGRLFGLTEPQFGFWAALAIHDTSSVVGAGAAFGPQAVLIATVVKLTRALWIIPLSFLLAHWGGGKGRLSVPLFLVGFLAAAALCSLLPQYAPLWKQLNLIGKRLMVAALFLIGAGLSTRELKEIGLRPLLAALTLWVLVSALTLLAVKAGLMPQLILS